jgi:hypothetical protein
LKITTLEELLGTPTADEMTQVVRVEGLGVFRVKALSLDELHRARQAANETGEFDQARWSTMLLHLAMVEPALTYDQAARLRLRPGFLVEELTTTIGKFSGMGRTGEILKEAVDEAERSFRNEPGEVLDVSVGEGDGPAGQ